MQAAAGTVIDGKVVLNGVTLPEGALVTVLSRDTEASVRLSPTEEADLMAALDEANQEAGTAADEILARLRRFPRAMPGAWARPSSAIPAREPGN